MNTDTAIKILKQHNLWRRGGDDTIAMRKPKEIGEAIDVVIEAVSHGPHETPGDGQQSTIAALQQQVREMREVIDKLPATADGVHVTPGMHIWFYSPKTGPSFIEEFKVVGWDDLHGMDDGIMFVLNVITEQGESDGLNLACCYSTHEAAILAKHEPEAWEPYSGEETYEEYKERMTAKHAPKHATGCDE